VMRDYRGLVVGLEIFFGVVFLIEYLVRLWCIADAPGPGSAIGKRLRFIVSPLAIIDLVVIVSSLLPLFFTDVAILRLVRLVRLIALAKFNRFSHAVEEISKAVWGRRYELIVTIALAWVLLLCGALALYWAEGDVQPDKFGSIPRSLWWSIITLTTVGYGDVSPVTPLGKVLASVVALTGVALVAMPAGIMAAAFSNAMEKKRQAEREEAKKLRKMERDVAKAEKVAREAKELAEDAGEEARRDP